MGRRSHTRSLGLWMNGAFVGTWSLGAHGPDTLQYDLAWTRSEQGRPLSLSLPFMPGNEAHRGNTVRAYFENLLPDSQNIRERLAYLLTRPVAETRLGTLRRGCPSQWCGAALR